MGYGVALASLLDSVSELPVKEKIDALNEIRAKLHDLSPFKSEPVDLVLWVPDKEVEANSYNPNSCAPPELELLGVSILNDGFTQPVVTFAEETRREIVDGFHRGRICKENKDVRKRVMGYLPVVTINSDRGDKCDRIAATIRHNRARGKHKVEAMSDIVVELKRRNWPDEKIAKNLGMEKDEILRLCQITGLSELFSDQEFSESWDLNVEDEPVEPLEE